MVHHKRTNTYTVPYEQDATRNKCIASSNKGLTSSIEKLKHIQHDNEMPISLRWPQLRQDGAEEFADLLWIASKGTASKMYKPCLPCMIYTILHINDLHSIICIAYKHILLLQNTPCIYIYIQCACVSVYNSYSTETSLISTSFYTPK